MTSLEERNLIYGLCDPRTGELRYVGMTEFAVSKRVKQHYKSARHPLSHCHNWMKSLLNEGIHPDSFVIEVCPGLTRDELGNVERFYISYFKSLGCNLTNMTKGGDGNKPTGPLNGMFGKHHSLESIKQMSEAQSGPKHWAWGRPRSVQTATKIGEPQKKCVRCENDGSVFASVKDAANFYKISYGRVTSVCQGKSKHTVGLNFSYVSKETPLCISSTPAKPEKEKKSSRGKSVTCLNDGRVFHSGVFAAANYGITNLIVSRSCRSGRSYKGLRFAFVTPARGLS